MSTRVFVPYRPQRYDRNKGGLVDTFPSLFKAETFGEMTFLLTSSVKPFNTRPIIDELREKLEDFTEEDYVLLVGNPIIMSLVATIAADASGGPVRFLQWSDGAYVEVEADLSDPDPEDQ